MLRAFASTALLAAVFSVLDVGPSWSQEAGSRALTLELNSAQPSEKGCRLTFVVTNALGADLSKAAFEIALFNEAGVVDRLTVLDLSELPVNKTKVARFDLAGVDCAKISRVLVNVATQCEGEGIDARACLKALKPETKSGIAFGM